MSHDVNRPTGIQEEPDKSTKKSGEEVPTTVRRERTISEDSFAEAGRRGGETVRERYGTPFFQTIGRLGAQAGAEKGGIARKEELGSEGYSRLGRMGGKAVVEKYGSDHMREIGRKGGRARVAQSRAVELPSDEGAES